MMEHPTQASPGRDHMKRKRSSRVGQEFRRDIPSVGCLIAAALVLVCRAGAVAAADVPTLTLPKTMEAPVVDGVLDDVCWTQAARTGDFVVYDSGRAPEVQTRAWVAADKTNLYIAFDCKEPHLEQMTTDAKRPDDRISGDDCVEVFLQPGSRTGYFHLLVNAAGTRGDRICDEKGTRDESWNGAWRSAVRRFAEKEGVPAHWAAELAVPFRDLSQLLRAGRPWRANFCRTRRVGQVASLSWSRSPDGFHDPSRFGVLKALPKSIGRHALRVEELRAGTYGVGTSGWRYTVWARVFNRGGPARLVIAEVLDQPADGKATTSEAEVLIPEEGSTTLAVAVPITAPGKRAATLRLRAQDDRTLLMEATVDPERFEPLLSGFMRRSVYYGEEHAVAMVQTSCENGTAGRFPARVRIDGTGVSVSADIDERGRATASLPIRRLEQGKHVVTAEIMDGKSVLAHVAFPLYKVDPGNGSVVQTDREQRVVTVDGEPFFPIGLFRVPTEDLREVADMGFNTVISWMERPRPVRIEDQPAYLDAAHAVGLKVIDYPCQYAPRGNLNYANDSFAQNFDEFISNELTKCTTMVRNHPAMLAWYTPDEPNLAAPYLDEGEDRMVKLCRRYYETLRDDDPAHPVYGLFCYSVPMGKGWQNTYDIAGVDAYWCPLARDHTPLVPALATAGAEAVTRHYEKPFWLVLEAERYSNSARCLSPAEQRCQTYLALIQGARGILYFIHPVRYQPLWKEFKSLNAEIRTLAPYALSDSEPPSVTVTPSSLQNLLLVRAFRKGTDVVLLAANPSRMDAGAVFALKGFKTEKVEVLFEDRSPLPVHKGGFEDQVPSYATRAYRLHSRTMDAGTVTVRLERVGRMPERAHEAPPVKTPEGKNLVPDPSFESKQWRFADWDRKFGNVQGEWVGDAHYGKVAAWIQREHGEGTAQWISPWITLKPGTAYRFGAWMRSRIAEGLTGPKLFMLRQHGDTLGPIISVPGKCVALPSGETTWTRYAGDFSTGPNSVTVRIFCRLGRCRGQAWFDDVFLHEVTGQGIGVVNLVRNGSFEPGDVPGWPDWWRILDKPEPGVKYGPITEHGGLNWSFDPEDPVHGKQSLRISRVGSAEDRNLDPWVFVAQPIRVTTGEPYTLSLFLRADHPEAAVRIFLVDHRWKDSNWKRVGVGPDWERHTLTWTIPEGTEQVLVRFAPATPGTFWVDAVQVEPGNAAGPFTPAAGDK